MHRDWSQTLREDHEAIILADKLSFHNVFASEHLTDAREKLTKSALFLAMLIYSAERIKLATGTTNPAQIHPVIVAGNAAMFDHLAQGRFIIGVSPGALTSDAEELGILDEERNKMFAEAATAV